MAVEVITLDDEVVTIQTMEQGPPGPQGPPGEPSYIPGPVGPPGTNGNTVLSGAGDPSTVLGVNGDFYINTTTDTIFGPKKTTGWGTGTSLVGPAGPMGPQGQVAVLVGDTPPVGAENNSLWFETDTGLFFINFFDGNSTQWVALSGGGTVGGDGGSGGGSNVIPSDSAPKMDGVAAPGIDNTYSRFDHVHPSDTSRAAANNPSITGSISLTSTGTVGVSGTLGDVFFGVRGGSFVVNTTGDASGTDIINVTKAGQLGVTSPGHASLVMNAAGGTFASELVGKKGGLNRWAVRIGAGGTAETGGNVSSDFMISRFSDDGATELGVPLVITRSNGCVGVTGGGIANGTRADLAALGITGPSNGGGIALKDGAAFGGIWMQGGQLYLGAHPSTPYLTYGLLVYNGGATVNGALSVMSSLYVNGTVFLNSKPGLVVSGTYVSMYDYTGNTSILCGQGDNNIYRANQHSFQSFQGAQSLATINANGIQLFGGGHVEASYGYRCKAGNAGAYGANNFHLDWQSPWVNCWIDSSQVGTIAWASDYRIKKDVAPLPSQWETVKALRPIKYTHKEYSLPSHVEHNRALKEEDADAETHPLVQASDVEQWGFMAHKLQETLTQSAASGVKDAPDQLQSPNPWTVIASLTKALQEAMARIEKLEQRVVQETMTRIEKLAERD